MSKVEAYKICKERGHTPSNEILMSNPPMNRCKFCGTTYRYESTLVEFGVPTEES